MNSNLKTVVGFEISRTLKKPLFWVMSLLGPLGIIAIFMVSMFSSMSGQETIDNQGEDAGFTFSYVDASGLVKPQIAQTMGGTAITDPEAGISAVKDGTLDAFFDIPADPSVTPVQVYGVDIGILNSMSYESVAKTLLQLSVQESLGDPKQVQISLGQIPSESTIYRDGVETGGFMGMIAPVAFLVLFFLIIVLLGNKMLTSTLEEKENRVTEMILTTIDPTSLLAGKLISVFILGIVQIAVLLVPTVIVAAVFPQVIGLEGFSFSDLVFEPQAMVLGALLLLAGYALFAAASSAVGAAMPTAQDAGGAFSAVMLLSVMPFWAFMLIVSSPESLAVKFLTYFPFSAAITGMIRNATGSLTWTEGLIAVAIIFAAALACLRLSVIIFKQGSISYSKAVNLKALFAKR
ncbi:MAG: ABC transporter permease [Propionibacteriaceae bacterium]|jgi:ABC-2 type transport system permease protein|nr:ABC transporter permease [Propionibacteriaceae bacterium]